MEIPRSEVKALKIAHLIPKLGKVASAGLTSLSASPATPALPVARCARHCKPCQRGMASFEPIYRDLGWNGRAIKVRLRCAECPYASRRNPEDWRAPEPCEGCGRPVIWELRRPLPRHVVCSDECRLRVYRAIGRARRRSLVRSRSCLVCGLSYMPKRSDARYCSAACKQKVHRDRGKLAQAATAATQEPQDGLFDW